MGYRRTTEPTSEPITTAEAKTHIRVDHSSDDTYIDTLIVAARRYCETYTNTTLFQSTWTLTLDEFPAREYGGPIDGHDVSRIDLPRPPLISVTSIAYYDTDGASQTVSASDYIVDTSNPHRGSIYLAPNAVWPPTQDRRNAVTIVYVAGYATTAAIPAEFKHAMKLLIGHWYENRETVVVGTISKELEFTLEALLRLNDVSGVG